MQSQASSSPCSLDTTVHAWLRTMRRGCDGPVIIVACALRDGSHCDDRAMMRSTIALLLGRIAGETWVRMCVVYGLYVWSLRLSRGFLRRVISAQMVVFTASTREFSTCLCVLLKSPRVTLANALRTMLILGH